MENVYLFTVRFEVPPNYPSKAAWTESCDEFGQELHAWIVKHPMVQGCGVHKVTLACEGEEIPDSPLAGPA